MGEDQEVALARTPPVEMAESAKSGGWRRVTTSLGYTYEGEVDVELTTHNVLVLRNSSTGSWTKLMWNTVVVIQGKACDRV